MLHSLKEGGVEVDRKVGGGATERDENPRVSPPLTHTHTHTRHPHPYPHLAAGLAPLLTPLLEFVPED